MIDTRIPRTRQFIAVRDGASSAGGRENRLAVRLWALLRAQALLQGRAHGTGDARYVEDDRRRLAARRESVQRP